jgi:hypothetical protein
VYDVGEDWLLLLQNAGLEVDDAIEDEDADGEDVEVDDEVVN